MFTPKKELFKDKRAHILTELRLLRWCAEQTSKVRQQIEDLKLENLYVLEDVREHESCRWDPN
jgi:hypothetical protein